MPRMESNYPFSEIPGREEVEGACGGRHRHPLPSRTTWDLFRQTCRRAAWRGRRDSRWVELKKSAAGNLVLPPGFHFGMSFFAGRRIRVQSFRRCDPANCGVRGVRHCRNLRELVPLALQLLNPLLQGVFEPMAGRLMRLRLWESPRQNALQLFPDSLLALTKPPRINQERTGRRIPTHRPSIASVRLPSVYLARRSCSSPAIPPHQPGWGHPSRRARTCRRWRTA
jgi:hypothetical protein